MAGPHGEAAVGPSSARRQAVQEALSARLMPDGQMGMWRCGLVGGLPLVGFTVRAVGNAHICYLLNGGRPAMLLSGLPLAPAHGRPAVAAVLAIAC
jgi:hypothetical protein